MTSVGLTGRIGHGRPPLYKQVEAYVRKQIRQGDWPAGHKLDLDELARQTHISRPVVQQALQSLSSQGVLVRRPRSGTYVADNASAQMGEAQLSASSKSLVLIVPYIGLPEYSRLAEGAGDAARARGLDLVIAGTDNTPERYQESIRRHLQSPPFGLIIVPPFDTALPLDLLHEIEASGVPVACCYRRIGDERWPLVLDDGEHAGELVAEHLIQTGRRRLCFVCNRVSPFSTAGSPNTTLPLLGFTRAAMRHMHEVDELQELRVNYVVDHVHWNHNDSLLPTIRAFLEANPQLDGFFCHSPFLADAVYHVLCDLGRSIPEDVAIVGNGDYLEYARYARQQLTTVAYSYKRIGEELLKLLETIRGGSRSPIYDAVRVQGELCIRNSSAPKLR
jgi:LacI family transcriptional regulator